MKLKTLISISLSSLFICSTAIAEDGDKGKGKKNRPSFEKLDTDSDGKISLAEFQAGAKDATKAGERFAKKDKDSDGFLTKEEFGKKGKKGPKKDKEENV